MAQAQAAYEAAKLARDHAGHHATEAHAKQVEEEECRRVCMALACDDVALDLCAVAREETANG